MKTQIVIYTLVFAFLSVSPSQTSAQASGGQSGKNWRGEYLVAVSTVKSAQSNEKFVWPGKSGTSDRSANVAEADNAVNERFRSEMLRLASDAKTAAIPVKIPPTQIQSQHKNNLSTGAKIAIGVAIAVGVIAAIFIVKRCRNEMGCGAGQ